MTLWQRLKRPPWRTLLLLAALLGVAGLAYLAWSPGERVADGRDDTGSNGIWLQHGWLGDDAWFETNGRDPARFRSAEKIQQLRTQLTRHGIKYVFPHLCPCLPDGSITAHDPVQMERFLDGFSSISVLPWIGGVHDESAHPGVKAWRARFTSSAAALLTAHPRLAGVHVNIEPMPEGDSDYLVLLDELRATLPPGKMISVAAYPPPTRWHPFPDVHWGESYFREVAKRADQIVPMLYDTGIKWQKPYRKLMVDWTTEVLAWSGGKPVLLGLPAYDDAGSGYHNPKVENLRNALRGVHAALANGKPASYGGIAIYSEWEMGGEDWKALDEEFCKSRGNVD
ncbi:glycosyl hydrolase family 18 protein [Haloferula sp. BvORR071]|uniref:glycosyl hydrolase family 18 protein n=1 Tax=Haloferula sp. BvORR071 TaxID=1396141 RepID=UPI0005572491|nr:glycosyl hydrolase family 18 protein [Haloferula sp. BvORR071]